MRRGKYIIVDTGQAVLAVMGNEAFTHAHLRNGLPEFWKTTGAGFFTVRAVDDRVVVEVEGRSQLLNLDSDPEMDPKYIARAMGINPYKPPPADEA